MAADPTSVGWAGVRLASYRLRQTFRYDYAAPITDLNHRLVVVPPARFGDQRRTYHDLLVELEEVRVRHREALDPRLLPCPPDGRGDRIRRRGLRGELRFRAEPHRRRLAGRRLHAGSHAPHGGG